MAKRAMENENTAAGCAGCFYHRTQPMTVPTAGPQMFYKSGAAQKAGRDFPQNFYRQNDLK